MEFNSSLRTRIVAYFAGFGLISCVLLVGAMSLVFNHIERQFIYTFLDGELEHFSELATVKPGLNPLHGEEVLGLLVMSTDRSAEYPFLARPNGKPFKTTFHGREYIGLASEKGPQRYVVLFDVTDYDQLGYILLGATILITLTFVLLTVKLAFSLSGHVMAPVTRLAGMIRNLPESVPQKLAAEFGSDEVGELARAFDNYMERQARSVTREQNFTADASHELRTPVAVIQGAAEVLLARDDTPPEIRKRVERIARAAQDMSQSITAMLMLARDPAQGGYTEQTNVADVVHHACDFYRPLLAGRDVVMELNISAQPIIAGAPNLMHILVSNLIRNACTYTNQGKVVISLTDKEFCVSDTGIGIAASDLKRIFERGYRALGAPGEGTGLGLAIAKRICDHYGWRISIESEPGKGTLVHWQFIQD